MDIETVEGCEHYTNKAALISPCCHQPYWCKQCHDNKEGHLMNRKAVRKLICKCCFTQQKVQSACKNCGVRFGKYCCLECRLFDDEDKGQFHCYECGICRVGGKKQFFHCPNCNICLSVKMLEKGHKCQKDASHADCQYCDKNLHTSTIPCIKLQCGHLVHANCLDLMSRTGQPVCSICNRNPSTSKSSKT